MIEDKNGNATRLHDPFDLHAISPQVDQHPAHSLQEMAAFFLDEAVAEGLETHVDHS